MHDGADAGHEQQQHDGQLIDIEAEVDGERPDLDEAVEVDGLRTGAQDPTKAATESRKESATAGMPTRWLASPRRRPASVSSRHASRGSKGIRSRTDMD